MNNLNEDPSKDPVEEHKKLRGKIEVVSTAPVNEKTLPIVYTPGVGAVCMRLSEHPEEAAELTWKQSTVAIVSDGTAVLGLGDIGPLGALPVMEGKAMLFKEFGGINGVPIVLDTKDPDEIIRTVKNIAPGFGGINLEDIKAPECFYIEETLKNELNIPVFHDDQHGTAIVTLAGIINSLKIVNKDLNECWVVVSGVGAAGVAISKLLKLYAPKVNILAIDSKGIISKDRKDLNEVKQKLVDDSIIYSEDGGDLAKALIDADIFVGVSKPGVISGNMIKTMKPEPIIFAMANPDPEILPEDAKAAGAAVTATGRSDFDNQINNALVFPGIFKGALAGGISAITEDHKLAVAIAVADFVEDPTPGRIIPSIFDPGLSDAIAAVVV